MLLQEVVEAHSRLKEHYNNCTLVVSSEHARAQMNADWEFESGLEVFQTMEGVFKARDGEYFLLDGAISKAGSPDQLNDRRVALIRPEESFMFGHDAVTEQYYLIGHGKEQDKYLAEMATYQFFLAPYSFTTLPLTEVLFSEPASGRIISVREQAEEDGERLLVIRHLLQAQGSKMPTTITLLRDKLCAVQRIERDYPDPESPSHLQGRRIQICEYSDADDSLPLLSNVEITYYLREGKGPSNNVRPRVQDVYNVESTLSPPPPRDFIAGTYLNSFDRVGGRESRPDRWQWVLAVNGVLLIGISVILARRWAKKSPSADNDPVEMDV
ncbi:hypothetical protein [Maioricimonas rarisocia]|uniref:hypothetical protein n=1 Tax=Maioricimonas rarisocia TaxID=2528026 RepID=UPI0011A5C87C|nr:hypothetical protein [Maioricimonas rarisocia]